MTRHWVTKYALSTGIFILEDAEISEGNYLSKIDIDTRIHHFYSSKDFHDNPEAAATRANEMRIKKIVSLRKQITTLEKMTFQAAS